jgi:O-methyltransferase
LTRAVAEPRELYLELLKKTLTRYDVGERHRPLWERISPRESRIARVRKRAILGAKGLLPPDVDVVRKAPFDPYLRENGLDTPADAETMIGLKRLDNLQDCIADILRRNVPGDLMECGAWRGGACIFMRAVLAAYGDRSRTVWVADSFAGLPVPAGGSEDAHIWEGGEMAVSLEEVRANFQRYELLDTQVRFLKGYFKDTLPTAPVERLALLRVDGDLYDSVMQTLQFLYPKLSVGGYVVLDDYHQKLPPAVRAVDDYRRQHSITEEIVRVDYYGAYWRKEK